MTDEPWTREKMFAEADAPQTRSSGPRVTIAEGMFWHTKDGEQRWMTGDQLIARIDVGIATAAKKQFDGMAQVVEALGIKFREQRDQLRQQLEADVRELSFEVREEVSLLRRERAALAEQQKDLEETTRKLRLVGKGAA